VRTGKNTLIKNNQSSSLGLIEENMELSLIHLAVQLKQYKKYVLLLSSINQKS